LLAFFMPLNQAVRVYVVKKQTIAHFPSWTSAVAAGKWRLTGGNSGESLPQALFREHSFLSGHV